MFVLGLLEEMADSRATVEKEHTKMCWTHHPVPESKELLKRKKNEACKKNVGINLEELPMAGKL